MLRHMADAEATFVATNVNPDFCDVDGCVVPFEIEQRLTEEKTQYSPTVFARGGKVLPVGAVIRGVVGNAGKGVLSGVSQGDGDIVTTEGSKVLFVHGRAACHHGHEVEMNVKT